MSELIKFDQAVGGAIHISHLVDGEPLTGLTAAKYQIVSRNNIVVLTLELGSGVQFTDGEVVITITEQAADPLIGEYTHHCLGRDNAGRAVSVLKGQISFNKTIPRLQP